MMNDMDIQNTIDGYQLEFDQKGFIVVDGEEVHFDSDIDFNEWIIVEESGLISDSHRDDPACRGGLFSFDEIQQWRDTVHRAR